MSDPPKPPALPEDDGDYIDIRDSDIIDAERRSRSVPPPTPEGADSVLAQTVLAMLESR